MTNNKILSLISEDKIIEAMHLASKLYNHSEEVKILVSQKARLKNIESLFLKGLTSESNYSAEMNKIRLALISFIQELEESSESNETLRKEIDTFEKLSLNTIIQNHSGTGHNIGRDYIEGDKC